MKDDEIKKRTLINLLVYSVIPITLIIYGLSSDITMLKWLFVIGGVTIICFWIVLWIVLFRPQKDGKV